MRQKSGAYWRGLSTSTSTTWLSIMAVVVLSPMLQLVVATSSSTLSSHSTPIIPPTTIASANINQQQQYLPSLLKSHLPHPQYETINTNPPQWSDLPLMEEQLSTLENNFLNIQGQYYSLPLIHDAVSANVINFDELTIESTSADLNSPDDMSVKILETDMLISENMAVFSSNTKSIMSCMQTVKAQLLLLNDQQHQIQRLFHKKKWIQERRELTLYYFNFFIKRYPFIPSGFEKSVVTTANRVDMAHEFFKILRKRFIPFLLPAVNDQDRHSFEALATDAFRIEERIASVFGSMPEQYKKMCYQQFHMMGRVWPINAPFPFVKIEQDGGDGIQLPFLFSNLQPSDNKEKYKSQKITPPRSLAKSESGKKENWRKFRNKPRLSS